MFNINVSKKPLSKILSEESGFRVAEQDGGYVKLSDSTNVAKADIEDAKVKQESIYLQDYKDELIKAINAKCELEIVSGFPSSALGAEHIYQSDEKDQLNLVGRVSANKDGLFKCGVKQEDGSVVWDWKPHTSAQLQVVLQDGDTYKEQLLIKATQLKGSVNLAINIEELELISW